MQSTLVVRQFGELLASVCLPSRWRQAVAERCREATHDAEAERLQARRAELEAEHKRVVTAFTKGYLSEVDMDAQVERVRAELVTLPIPVVHTAEECTEAAIMVGETLADMAGYWTEATAEERRDIVWALLTLDGLIYDLERRAIVGLQVRSDVLPVLALGLEREWEQREDGLWLRAESAQTHAARVEGLPKPNFRRRRLTEAQQREVRELVRAGLSPKRAADQMGVSPWMVWRMLKGDNPNVGLRGHERTLNPEQCAEALRLLHQGLSLRKVAARFGVSRQAIWRLVRSQQNGGDA